MRPLLLDIGEALMKSPDPRQTIIDLLSESPAASDSSSHSMRLIKLCGFTRPSDVEVALQCGINMVGLIFAPKSPRVVSDEQAKAIVQLVRRYGERSGQSTMLVSELARLQADKLSPKLWYQRCTELLRKVTLRQPLAVGVFQDQSAQEVRQI